MRSRIAAPLTSLVLGIGAALAHTAHAADAPAASDAPALLLPAVLDSAERHYPLLQAARLEQRARMDAEMAARGAFDLSVRAKGDLRPAGFYENYLGDVELSQPTRLWGSRFYAGYRNGSGDFASYDGGRLTDGSGEWRVGAAIPLLRGGAIDAPRAELRGARIEVDRFAPEFALERVELRRDATDAYWRWVAAGQTVDVARRLVETAEQRQSQIARRVESGNEPAIDLVDNERLVVERQARLRASERDLRQAAVRLSLFVRDEAGLPIVPEAAALPSRFPQESAIDDETVERDLAAARERHPILVRLLLERERLDVERRLMRNRLLPQLDLVVEGSRDEGSPEAGIDTTGKLSAEPRGDTEVKAQIRLQLPVQMRRARGRLGVAEIRIEQLDRRIQFAREQLVAEVEVAVEALRAAYVLTEQARTNARLAAQLRDAEQRKLAAGLSNLIDLNIREVQAATAEQALVSAQSAYFRARAQYRASVAEYRADVAEFTVPEPA